MKIQPGIDLGRLLGPVGLPAKREEPVAAAESAQVRSPSEIYSKLEILGLGRLLLSKTCGGYGYVPRPSAHLAQAFQQYESTYFDEEILKVTFVENDQTFKARLMSDVSLRSELERKLGGQIILKENAAILVRRSRQTYKFADVSRDAIGFLEAITGRLNEGEIKLKLEKFLRPEIEDKAAAGIAGVGSVSMGGLVGGPLNPKMAKALGGKAQVKTEEGLGFDSGSSETLQLIEIQWLIQKWTQWTSMLTNLLHAMHEAKMAVIRNLRA